MRKSKIIFALNKTSNNSLGISFSSNKIKFTYLAVVSDTLTLQFTDIVEVDFNFDDELWKYKTNQKILTNISNQILKVLHKIDTDTLTLSLSISTSQAFIITLPIDLSEGISSINSKIYWELSNYFPDNYNEFVVNMYKLDSSLPFSKAGDFLIVAVKKNTLEFIKRIFKISDTQINRIDIEHFSAENSLRKNYPHKLTGKNVLLIGLKNSRADFGLIQDEKYKLFAYTTCNSHVEYNLNIIQKIKSLLTAKYFSNGIDEIFLYGDEIRNDTIESIKKLNNYKVEILNPFENINASTQYLSDESLRKIQYIFAPSCGAALRNFKKN